MHVFRGDGFLVEERSVFLQSLAELDRGGDVELGVRLDEDVHLRPDRVANGGDAVLRNLGLAQRDRVVVLLAERVELERRVPHVHDHLGLVGVLRGRAGVGVPAVGVHPDPRAVRAAQQPVYGLPEDLSLQVPQRDVDAGQGRGRNAPAPRLLVKVEHVVQHAGVERVPSHQVARRQRLHERHHFCVVLHGAGVAEAVQPRLVGVQLDHEPVAAGVVVPRRKPPELHARYRRHCVPPFAFACLVRPRSVEYRTCGALL